MVQAVFFDRRVTCALVRDETIDIIAVRADAAASALVYAKFGVDCMVVGVCSTMQHPELC